MGRLLVLVALMAAYFWFARRRHARRGAPGEAAARAMADIPPVLLIVMLASLGDRYLSRIGWANAAVTPGWIAGLVVGVLLADPLRRLVLRWYGLTPEPQR